MAKPLTCKFEAKTAHAPDGADGTGADEEGQHGEQAPPPLAADTVSAARRRGNRVGGQREPCAADAPPKQRGQRTEKQKDLLVLVLIKTCLCLH